MSILLNPRILKKLEDSKLDEEIKSFLREMLYFELEHFEEDTPRYSRFYDHNIEKHAKKFELVKNEV